MDFTSKLRQLSAFDFKKYHLATRSELYAFLFALPLFIGYESYIQFGQSGSAFKVYNGVDLWIKNVLTVFGGDSFWLTTAAILFAGFVIFRRNSNSLKFFNWKYIFPVILESIGWALVFIYTVRFIMTNLPMQVGATGRSAWGDFAMSLGAGLYEELFFRVILISVLVWVFQKLFKNQKRLWNYTFAVILAALLFSAVHYMGSMGDDFQLNSFTQRFLGGLILSGVYAWRGFAVAAWSHAIYDLMVFFVL